MTTCMPCRQEVWGTRPVRPYRPPGPLPPASAPKPRLQKTPLPSPPAAHVQSWVALTGAARRPARALPNRGERLVDEPCAVISEREGAAWCQ